MFSNERDYNNARTYYITIATIRDTFFFGWKGSQKLRIIVTTVTGLPLSSSTRACKWVQLDWPISDYCLLCETESPSVRRVVSNWRKNPIETFRSDGFVFRVISEMSWPPPPPPPRTYREIRKTFSVSFRRIIKVYPPKKIRAKVFVQIWNANFFLLSKTSFYYIKIFSF